MKRNAAYAGTIGAGLAAMALALSACQTGPAARDTEKRIDATMEQSAQSATSGVPVDVSQALIPPLQINLPKGRKAPVESRFDLVVHNASARRVFMGLVEGTSFGMVLAPDVDGTVTLNLHDVTVPEAMEAIRRVYGYGFYREGNRYFVSGRGIQTRLFSVNYLNLKRKGISTTFVSAGGITQNQQAGTNGATSTGAISTTGALTSSGGATSNPIPSISVETDTDTDFWKDLQRTIQTIVGDGPGRRVIVNPQTNLIVVRASPSELRTVEDFLGETAMAVSRQVVLEAKILEVSLSDRYQTGVNWSQLTSVGGTNITLGQTGGGSIFNGGGVSGNAGVSLGNLSPGGGGFNPDPGTGVSAFGGVFTLAAQSGNFNAFLEALQGQGQVQVLSSPRVSTVNNQKAVIKVGADEFFVTGISVVAGTTGAAQTAYQYQPFFSGIALDVTPQIADNGEIILHIHPAITEVTSQDKPTPSGNAAPFARSSVQESDNIVRAKSGHVVVIAGLMKEGTTDDNAAVPLLGDIPIAGNLFKHKRIVRVKKELVILLKPTVVTNDQMWADMINDSKKRMDGVRKGF
jgi:MSHA biogenesis protein MshL